MIRMVGLAVVCLVGLGAMLVALAGTAASRPPNVSSPDQTTVGSDVEHDTLAKADKLEIADAREAIKTEPVTPTAKALNDTLPQPPSPTATPKIVNRHWHDPSTKKVAAVSPDQRTKGQEPKKGKNVERAKLPADLRPCRRREGFAGLLRALNLSPGCDT
jgi:hypothetical protein